MCWFEYNMQQRHTNHPVVGRFNEKKLLTLIGFTVQFDLVGLHDFLNSLAHVTQPDVDASFLEVR